ncbi:exosortase E/protease, VPEID-CTERM system [uncultured Paludibaculum sp.]|uniref:exosortase E/protease, VPEID-CTERM system n=1 Tax=uncultured Paludibaculum sp. TaxID=1765020 RepID=UPI002AABAF32|nr:exosortase E/protease, VPEID-CTERM system [uncultured Paludibaculum sp.]
MLLDTGNLPAQGGLATWIRYSGSGLVRAVAALFASALIFSQYGILGILAVMRRQPGPVRYHFLAAHMLLMAAFGLLSPHLFAGASSQVSPWVALSWLLSGLSAVIFLGLSLLPASFWLPLLRTVGWGWGWGLAVAAVSTAARPAALAMWKSSSAPTFEFVHFLLRPILPGLTANPLTAEIGTKNFSVFVEPACSGYEGIGLFLIFSTAWLYFFRREYRFPAALALIPAGALLMWVLNALRIAMLILIGHAGADRIAMGGFHSQAGWIAFTSTAILFCVLSRRIQFFQHPSPRSSPVAHGDATQSQAVAAYLMPFLAILAASLVSKAASADFEWLYPLRLLAALAALWHFRKAYGGVDWRFGPAAAVVGLLVAAVWVWTTPAASGARTGLPAGFVAMSGPLQAAWLACRLLSAVITVPIAEELAFRGYLLRRVANPDFESVSWHSFSWLPFVVSTVAFGAMHESRWLGGIAAGAAYALIQMTRGRLGDAVAAHAVTNAALAALVWYTGDWRYW